MREKNFNKNIYILIENSFLVKSVCISVMFLILEKKKFLKIKKNGLLNSSLCIKICLV